MGLMLALARQIPREDRSLHAGGWATVVGQALRGSTLGILGLGRMGLQVARLARAFEMRVLAWRSNLTEQRCAEADVAFAGSNERLLRSEGSRGGREGGRRGRDRWAPCPSHKHTKYSKNILAPL